MRTLPILLILSLSSPALAQIRLLTIQTARPGPGILAPDLNGDGIRDLWIGDEEGGAAAGFAGRVEVFSGFDGSSLLALVGEANGDRYGSALTVIGDLDGDGVRDVAVGAPGATLDPNHRPYVQLRSGATGGLLGKWQGPTQTSGYGAALASVGDLNGDGVGDVGIAASGHVASDRAFVEVLSGADGTQHWRSATSEASDLPISVLGIEDQDADGVRDVIVGFAVEERVELLSGASGNLVHPINAPSSNQSGNPHGFGAALATGADFDGDGRADLLVSAPLQRVEPITGPVYEGSLYNGSVFVYLGGDLGSAPVRQVDANPGESGFGWSLAALGDFDGDGAADFVTGSQRSQSGCCHFYQGTTRVCSGTDGESLFQFGSNTNGRYQDAGDWNGDGHSDYLVSGTPTEQHAGPQGTGIYETSIVAGDFAGILVDSFCGGTPAGCDPLMYFGGEPSVSSADSLALFALGFENGPQGFLLLGSSTSGVPFGSGQLCVAPPFVRRKAAIRDYPWSPTCDKSFSYEFVPGELGQGFMSVGEVVFAQFVSRGAGGSLGVSDGFSFTVYP